MTHDPGVPLAHYLHDHDNVSVRFTCDGCMASVDVPVAEVVARLQARGLGGEQTGIREVARFAERPCRKCGAMKWESRPAFSLG